MRKKLIDNVDHQASDPSAAERSRLISSDLIRSSALERLYKRKASVEDLIRSFEDYQRIKPRAA
jgi:hypothetical protein